MTRRWPVVPPIALAALAACAGSGARPPRSPASAQSSPSGDATVDRGVALYEQGRYAEAETVLSGAEGVRARAYLAASRVRLGKHREAEPPALEALRANPGNEVAAAALGEALVAQGRLDDAIRHLTVAIQADPSLPYAYYWRGQAYQRKRQIARMVEDYQAFLRLAPGAAEAPAVRVLLSSLE